PADGILTKGKAMIDYSFVTGESTPVLKEMGEIVYAGGKQIGSNIEILVIKEVAQSYLTRLWNKQDSNKKTNDNERSFVHLLSRYFTVILFAIAASTAVYWAIVDSSKLLAAVTAVLIIACPCALLLSNTFTNGNIIRRLGKNNFYLRNAQAIEDIAAIDTIVFDKTGTLTTGRFENVQYKGELLDETLQSKIAQLASQSTHPMSKSIAKLFKVVEKEKLLHYEEEPGIGISGNIGGTQIALGSYQMIKQADNSFLSKGNSQVFLIVNNVLVGHFVFSNTYRPKIAILIKKLQSHFKLAVLSGDNDGEKAYLSNMFGKNALLHFQQKPADKLATIEQMQQLGHKVMMVGDGLNDAGALKQANVGIAVAEQSNNFTPASDGILEAEQLVNLYKFIKICKANKQIVWLAFVISIIYNIVGMYFAVQGTLS
ncbi:MAG: heavy metal translocating P-type ATPase, partial [Chitinophagaceae bacterium]